MVKFLRQNLAGEGWTAPKGKSGNLKVESSAMCLLQRWTHAVQIPTSSTLQQNWRVLQRWPQNAVNQAPLHKPAGNWGGTLRSHCTWSRFKPVLLCFQRLGYFWHWNYTTKTPRTTNISEHPLRGWKPWELTVNQAHSNKGPLWVSACYTTGHSGETTHHTARPPHPDTPALRCRARPQECISHHMQLALSSDTVFHLQWRTKKQSHQSSWIPWVQETFSCKLHSLFSLEDLPSAIIEENARGGSAPWKPMQVLQWRPLGAILSDAVELLLESCHLPPRCQNGSDLHLCLQRYYFFQAWFGLTDSEY